MASANRNALDYYNGGTSDLVVGLGQGATSSTVNGLLEVFCGIPCMLAPPGVNDTNIIVFDPASTNIGQLGQDLGPLVPAGGVAGLIRGLITKTATSLIKNVNPTKGTQNCVNCSIATDATLAGRPASALPGNPVSIRVLQEHFGRSFGPAISRADIKSSLLEAGHGARGIVFGSRGDQVGHVFNVVNQRGTIRFLDGQPGKPASFEGFERFHLLRTN